MLLNIDIDTFSKYPEFSKTFLTILRDNMLVWWSVSAGCRGDHHGPDPAADHHPPLLPPLLPRHRPAEHHHHPDPTRHAGDMITSGTFVRERS